MQKKIIAVDGNSLLYRAFFALPGMTAPDGTPTGALHGFFGMLFQLIDRNPDFIIVAFDVHGKTFRHEKYLEYKAGRPETPQDLRTQFSLLKELLVRMGICVCECPGFEADDIIGTVSERYEKNGDDVLIVTGDRDALQLVTEKVHVLLTVKGITESVEYTPELLMSKYGLVSDQMRDLKALMGDNSDNIPGIPGIGEKTALKLLNDYHSLEGVLSHADEIKGKLGEKVRENQDSARFSYWLGTICKEAPIDCSEEKLIFSKEKMSGAIEQLKSLGLKKISSKIFQEYAPNGAAEQPEKEQREKAHTTVIHNLQELVKTIEDNPNPERMAVCFDDIFSFAFSEDEFYQVSSGETLFDEGLSVNSVLDALKPIFENESIKKVLFDKKKIKHFLNREGIELRGECHDLMIGDYLLDTLHPASSFRSLTEKYNVTVSYDASGMLHVAEAQKESIIKDGYAQIYNDMELPLADVLYDMEETGVYVDDTVLSDLQAIFQEQIESLQKEIYIKADCEFNILSTKQLGSVLFEKMGLPSGKKTKTGYSTDASSLEKLKEKYPIASDVLNYRFLTKLKSTYVDGLLEVRSKSDGRVRTTFNQCLTATGRLSSSEPNLQNIPARTALGREIRRAFTAPEGYFLVDGDYSQIELRILAHLSGDPTMIHAFKSGEDIHRRTAGEVFGVPFDEVTEEMRSAAKAVNFGIIYGISDYGLSENLNIPVWKAAEYIKMYLERYPNIQAFMQKCVEDGKKTGYAVTMFGRRRALPELKSGNYNTRSFGERVAMNMPIQGTAADIIKAAMNRVCAELKRQQLESRLILQVHDELILEVPEKEKEKVTLLLKDCMEHVCELSVPLTVDVKSGRSWYETK